MQCVGRHIARPACRESRSGLLIALVVYVLLIHSMDVMGLLVVNSYLISPTAPVMALVEESRCDQTGRHALCRRREPISPIAPSGSPVIVDLPTLLRYLPAMTIFQEVHVGLTPETLGWARI